MYGLHIMVQLDKLHTFGNSVVKTLILETSTWLDLIRKKHLILIQEMILKIALFMNIWLLVDSYHSLGTWAGLVVGNSTTSYDIVHWMMIGIATM